MKKLLTIAMASLFSISAIAGKNDITIRGQVSNPLADSVVFSYPDYDGNWVAFKYSRIAEKLDEQGRFIVMFPLPHKYTLVQIQNGNEATEIYGSPGDKINMTVDAQDFDATLEYSGLGMKADVANYMAKHMLANSFTLNIQTAIQQACAKEEQDFLTELNRLISKEQDFLMDNMKGLPPEFVQYWSNYYDYLKHNSILNYPRVHEMMKQKSYDITLTPEKSRVVKTVPAKFNDELMYISSYREYLMNYYFAQLTAEGVENNDNDPYKKDDKMLELCRQKMPNASEEYVSAFYLVQSIQNQSLDRVEWLYKTFTTNYPDSKYKKTLDKMLAIRRKLSPGAPAIDFTVTDSEGNKVKISELKGKVVYIDFWASWCGPCKAQFAHVKRIKEHFAGKDVVFVYVSIDEDEAAWLKAKEQYGLTGLHTREDGGWEAKIASEYGVKGIPAYFLVDKAGNFAVATTPRPSQAEELIKAIEGLL